PALALALAVQLALIAAVAAPRLAPRLTGTEYRIATVALDPIDPFRGAYVDLRLRGVPAFTRREGTVYVPLVRRRDGTYRGSGTRREPPTDGPFMRCHADGEVRCGIESFFASAKGGAAPGTRARPAGSHRTREDRRGRTRCSRRPGGTD
ncbi:MAG: GDYXXLXY domain-containing protein, partial [Chloroflexota bacterium]|nr:GDYXXLXY domain-containing protein [Chloroflexota bacterium]